MFEDRPQPGFKPMGSLNGRERLREVAYLERNNKHMHERLHKTGPSVNTKDQLAADFDRHLEQSYLMRRKHFGVLPTTPIAVPKLSTRSLRGSDSVSSAHKHSRRGTSSTSVSVATNPKRSVDDEVNVSLGSG